MGTNGTMDAINGEYYIIYIEWPCFVHVQEIDFQTNLPPFINFVRNFPSYFKKSDKSLT